MGEISEKDVRLFSKLLDRDKRVLHFLWDCVENTVAAVQNDVIDDIDGDPLDYLRTSGLIDPQYLAAFNVFAAQIEEGIISGIDRNSLSVEVKFRFNKEADFALGAIYAIFLRDTNKKILAAHVNIRPYTQKEILQRDILTSFSSDKKPQLFGEALNEWTARHNDDNIAYIQFDIERFKIINEKYGVETADELLSFINDTLGLVCTDDQPFCRLTADVFMVVTAFTDKEELIDFIHRLESRLTGFKDMEYRFVFGVAVAEDKTQHSRRHGDNATIARRSVKGKALTNIGFFDGGMRTEIKRRETIEEEMTGALLSGQFVMYLQPKYSISTGRIIGAEALARWIHPEKGMISPAEFIPVFEENGFILKLDQYIWECACKKIRSWIDEGMPVVPISVNISREYVKTFDVVGEISRLIAKYDIPVKYLELEITESVDSEGVEDIVGKMKSSGFTMLMDDFGSGYSSLNMLKTTQFDVLKIDRVFLSEFMESSRGRKIISHTISMSKDIGLEIIAEGVETEEQAKFLSTCGCDSAQGFYYSKPISESDFDKKLGVTNT